MERKSKYQKLFDEQNKSQFLCLGPFTCSNDEAEAEIVITGVEEKDGAIVPKDGEPVNIYVGVYEWKFNDEAIYVRSELPDVKKITGVSLTKSSLDDSLAQTFETKTLKAVEKDGKTIKKGTVGDVQISVTSGSEEEKILNIVSAALKIAAEQRKNARQAKKTNLVDPAGGTNESDEENEGQIQKVLDIVEQHNLTEAEQAMVDELFNQTIRHPGQTGNPEIQEQTDETYTIVDYTWDPNNSKFISVDSEEINQNQEKGVNEMAEETLEELLKAIQRKIGTEGSPVTESPVAAKAPIVVDGIDLVRCDFKTLQELYDDYYKNYGDEKIIKEKLAENKKTLDALNKKIRDFERKIKTLQATVDGLSPELKKEFEGYKKWQPEQLKAILKPEVYQRYLSYSEDVNRLATLKTEKKKAEEKRTAEEKEKNKLSETKLTKAYSTKLAVIQSAIELKRQKNLRDSFVRAINSGRLTEEEEAKCVAAKKNLDETIPGLEASIQRQLGIIDRVEKGNPLTLEQVKYLQEQEAAENANQTDDNNNKKPKHPKLRKVLKVLVPCAIAAAVLGGPIDYAVDNAEAKSDGVNAGTNVVQTYNSNGAHIYNLSEGGSVLELNTSGLDTIASGMGDQSYTREKWAMLWEEAQLTTKWSNAMIKEIGTSLGSSAAAELVALADTTDLTEVSNVTLNVVDTETSEERTNVISSNDGGVTVDNGDGTQTTTTTTTTTYDLVKTEDTTYQLAGAPLTDEIGPYMIEKGLTEKQANLFVDSYENGFAEAASDESYAFVVSTSTTEEGLQETSIATETKDKEDVGGQTAEVVATVSGQSIEKITADGNTVYAFTSDGAGAFVYNIDGASDMSETELASAIENAKYSDVLLSSAYIQGLGYFDSETLENALSKVDGAADVYGTATFNSTEQTVKLVYFDENGAVVSTEEHVVTAKANVEVGSDQMITGAVGCAMIQNGNGTHDYGYKVEKTSSEAVVASNNNSTKSKPKTLC